MSTWTRGRQCTKCPRKSTIGRQVVRIGQKLVHVVCERPLRKYAHWRVRSSCSCTVIYFFSEFVLVRPTPLIWHYMTVQENTYMLINFQGFFPLTYRVVWTPRVFVQIEKEKFFFPNMYQQITYIRVCVFLYQPKLVYYTIQYLLTTSYENIIIFFYFCR